MVGLQVIGCRGCNLIIWLGLLLFIVFYYKLVDVPFPKVLNILQIIENIS